jgi:hypothetical protein
LRGKHAVVWSLGAADTSRTSATTRPHSRLVIADAVFDAPPTLAQLRRQPLRPMFCEFRAREPGMYFIDDGALPRGVTLLGQLAHPPDCPEHVCYASWSSFALIFDLQWRHLHAKEQLAAAAEKTRAAASRRALAATRKRRAGGLTGMTRRTPLAAWTGLVPAKHARAVREMIKRTITELAAAPVKQRAAVLEALVERINAYNDKAGSFIDTAEREALLECLEDLAVVSKLGAITREIDAWRDW